MGERFTSQSNMVAGMRVLALCGASLAVLAALDQRASHPARAQVTLAQAPGAGPGGRPAYMPPDGAFTRQFRADADKAVNDAKPRAGRADRRTDAQKMSDNDGAIERAVRELSAKYGEYAADEIRKYLTGKFALAGLPVTVPPGYLAGAGAAPGRGQQSSTGVAAAGGAQAVDVPTQTWEKARADQAASSAVALARAVDGYVAMAKQGILTGNPGLVQAAKAAIRAHTAALQAIGAGAQRANHPGVDAATVSALEAAVGSAAVGTSLSNGALAEIEAFETKHKQHAMATPQSASATKLVAAQPPLGNMIIPADPVGLPSLCGESQGLCTAAPHDTVIASGRGAGDLRIEVGDYCSLSGACTKLPGGTTLQFPWAGPLVPQLVPDVPQGQQAPPPASDPAVTETLLRSVEHALLPEFVVGINLTYRRVVDIIEGETAKLPPEFRLRPFGDTGSAGAINGYVFGSEFISPSVLNVLSADAVLSRGEKLALNTIGTKLSGAGRYLLTDALVGETLFGDMTKRAAAEPIPPATLGGPIVKDRLWIWGSYGAQQIDLAAGASARGTVTSHPSSYSVNGLYQIAPDRPWGFNVALNLAGRLSPEAARQYTSPYVQDTIAFGNFTANLGLRYDLNRSINDTLQQSGSDPGFEWEAIAPRLGLTYGLGQERRTLLRQSYSRFADQLATGAGGWLNPLGSQSYAYFYHTTAEPPGALTGFPTSDSLRTPQAGGREQEYQGASLTFNKRLANRWLLRGNLGNQDWNWDLTTTETAELPTTVLGQAGRTSESLSPPTYRLEDTHIFNSNFYLTGMASYVGGGFQLVVPPTATQGGVYQPFVEIPAWRNTFQLYRTERPQEQAKIDANNFFNTGSLSHELKFGVGYRDADMVSLSRWGGGNYRVFDGPKTAPDLSAWAGRRFYRGSDVRIADYFFWSNPPPDVESAQPLTIQLPRPDDPLASSKGSWKQAHDDQWWLKAINWMKPDGSTVLPERAHPVTVAVIDTGLDLAHPELFGALWTDPTEPRRAPVPGLVRNPFKARWIGWNFLEKSSDLRDFNGHGTIVAGIIAANVNDGQGMAGINPWARIMPLKVADHRGRTDTIATAQAIVYAVDNGARVINLSLGGNKVSETVRRAIDYAASKNVLVVVAAGNEGVDVKGFTPSAFASTIAVAAVGPDLKRAGFSNWGGNLGVAAPGVDVVSLRAAGTDLLIHEKKDYQSGSAVVNERYYRVDGTSFAAPMVAGVASLILSVRPELSAEQVKRMILHSARDIDEPGRDRFTGYGLLDADAALSADPEFFIDAAIDDLDVVQKAGRPYLRVKGTARADRLKASWVEIGQGESPRSWKKVSGNVTRAVTEGTVAEIDAGNLAGAKVWTLRVIVEHQNGRRREGRYRLTLS